MFSEGIWKRACRIVPSRAVRRLGGLAASARAARWHFPTLHFVCASNVKLARWIRARAG